MKAGLFRLVNNKWEQHPASQPIREDQADLVISFAARHLLEADGAYAMLKNKFPKAQIVMCSTAGEIYHTTVSDGTLVAAALQFENTRVQAYDVNVNEYAGSYAAAMALAKKIPQEELQYLLVLSDGSFVNGSELVKGLASKIDKHVLITGGLAGDGVEFKSTLAGLNCQPAAGQIIAVGLYGSSLKVTHGSKGGWDIFGLEKTVTNSSANVLLELEDQNALDLYKKYLGDEAAGLPGSALLFPLSVIIPGSTKPVVRTILSINEEDKSMTFAGDIPVGSKVRFMKANFDRLTNAAAIAAQNSFPDGELPPVFSLLISCVGRKIILGSRVEEEVQAVENAFGNQTLLAGFYSYGEVSPFNEGGNCQLHNQTMTITSFYES